MQKKDNLGTSLSEECKYLENNLKHLGRLHHNGDSELRLLTDQRKYLLILEKPLIFQQVKNYKPVQYQYFKGYGYREMDE